MVSPLRQNTDMLGLLEPLSWRSVYVPITARSMQFAVDVARHKVLYVAWPILESLAPNDLSFKYTIPFREGIARTFKELFSKGLKPFMQSCMDDSPGTLIDPVHGTFQAQCVSYSEELDLARRDGIDVQVEFVYARGETETLKLEELASISAAVDEAGVLDKSVAAVDWQQEAPPEPTVDPLQAAMGVWDQVSTAAGQIALGIEGSINRCTSVIERVEALQDPTAWPLAANARRVQGQLQTLLEKQGTTKATLRSYTVPSEMGVGALALSLGVGLGALLGLNPRLASNGGRVRAGTVVVYP